MCGVEMVRDVMTADELEHDAVPTSGMNPSGEDRAHEPRGNNPLWSDRRRSRFNSNNSDEFHDVERADVEKQTVAH